MRSCQRTQWGHWHLKQTGKVKKLLSGSQVALAVKNPPANAEDIRDVESTPGSEISPGGQHGNPLQYSCLENPMNRGAWWATVHRIAELDMTEVTWHACTHELTANQKIMDLKCHLVLFCTATNHFSIGL